MAWTSRSQYDELKELGRGGFGQAKLIRKNIGTGQLYVVKEVNLAKVTEECGEDDALKTKVLEMTKLEAQNMMGLQHENIVRVYGFFEETYLQCPYYHIVMEYCELGDLGKAIREAYLNKTPFEERQIRRWSRQLTSAIKFLHDNKFVHRDIKPANIFLVAKRYSVKLGDFGLGKQVDKVAKGRGSITAIGTEAYSSPECSLMQPYTEKSDIWAFGVVVHELAVLRRPFEPTLNHPITYSIINSPPPRIPKQYSACLQQFIDLLLTKDPSKRPSMAVVAEHRAVSHSTNKDSIAGASSSSERQAPLQPVATVATLEPAPQQNPSPIVKSQFELRAGEAKLKDGTEADANNDQFTLVRKSAVLQQPISAPATIEEGGDEQLPPRVVSASPKTSLASQQESRPVTNDPNKDDSLTVNLRGTSSRPPPKPPRQVATPASPGTKVVAEPLPSKVPTQPRLSSSSAETLILRKEKTFAIKPTVTHSVTTTVAPQSFVIARTQQQDVGDPTKTTLLARKNKAFEDQLQQYSERTRTFQDVDRHAYDVCQTSHQTFRDLLWDLIYSRGINDNFEKVRALFLWLCAKDLSKIDFANPNSDSPEKFLMDLKKGNRNYATVFEMMCSYVSLQCSIIYGYAKGVNYHVGMKFAENSCNHSWCAVLIDGQWRLFDPEWASRVTLGKGSQVRYELDEFYFMPPPEQFIFTHFPIEQKWQLIKTPITLTDFENMPLLTSLFFKRHLEVGDNSRQLCLGAFNGEAVAEIRSSNDPNSLDFIYRLSKEGDEEDVNLNRSVFQTVDVSSRKAFFFVRPPTPGSFILSVFGLPLERLSSVADGGGTYNAIAEWKVVSKVANPSRLPPCSSSKWGGLTPNKAMKRGLKKFPVEGKLIADQNGAVEVVLETSAPTIEFSHRLTTSDQRFDSQTLKQSVMFRQCDGNRKVVFLVALPGKGEFGLEIFSSVPGEEERESLLHLCQYLLVRNDSKKQLLRFPVLGSNYLGPTKAFEDLGMKPVSHKDSYIVVADWSLPLEIVFESPKILKSSADLLLTTSNDRNYASFVLHQSIPARRQEFFKCRFPQPGMYKLQIYAKQADVNGGSATIPNIFNYLINVGGEIATGEVIPFPKQFNQWRGGHLAEPLNGILQRFDSRQELKTIRIRLAIQGALKVAALVNQTWTHFDLAKDGYWQGDVNLQDAWATGGDSCLLDVLGNFQADQPNSFSTLLEYKLMQNN